MPDTLSSSELAAQYGFTLAVLKSDSELYSIFKKATSQTWSASRFQAEVRASKWYQNHSEAWRNAAIQKEADPETYAARLSQVKVRVGMMATEYGASMTSKALNSLAEKAYQLGWDDNQLRRQLATYVWYTDGRMLGQAGQIETELRDYAASMGVKVSDSTILAQTRRAIKGVATVEEAMSSIRETAISAFPHLADRLRQGETVEEIASPYKQTMASLLELNPTAITLSDPTLRGALAQKSDKGPVLQTLYDFEDSLRKDKRWLKTQNAQDAGIGVASGLLRDWGLIS